LKIPVIIICLLRFLVVLTTYNQEEYQQLQLRMLPPWIPSNEIKVYIFLTHSYFILFINWPNSSVETVLCKVIENCGHDLAKGGENYAELVLQLMRKRINYII